MLSAIVPALDEALRIDACLARLRADPGVDEVIVVDGDSSDDTADRARRAGARVLESPRGRGRQLNAGASAAAGDVLWFVHVDAAPPPGASALIAGTLEDPDVVAGAFRTWTVSDAERPPRWAPLLHLADLRSRYSKLPYGDQAIFARATAFHRVGGFPDVPLMEDLAFSKRIRQVGELRIVAESVRVSGRRFESAPIKQTFWVNVFPALHAVGVPARVLARLYGNPR